MENGDYFGSYTLSETTLENLREIDSLLKLDRVPVDDAWSIIKPKKKTQAEKNVIVAQKIQNNASDMETEAIEESQFFFTQKERNNSGTSNNMEMTTEWLSVAECLLEIIENTNNPEKLDEDMKNLTDEEVENVMKYFNEKLSLKGTYNLCNSVCAMDIDRSVKYIRMICSNLLLQKIINLEGPSRLMNTVVQELVKKFPEDVQEFVFAPMINADIKDASIFLAIINGCSPQRRNDLILNFLTIAEELKKWHVTILSELIITKISEDFAREKLLNLLLDKASIYSCDKNYGKFVLSFLKLNSPVADGEKRKLIEIVAMNETIFKKVMENMLKNMYLYADMWHTP